MQSRQELMNIVDQLGERTLEQWLAHVQLGAYELDNAQTDEVREAVLRCIVHRAQGAINCLYSK